MARDMLQEHGTTATLKRPAATFNPATGAISGDPIICAGIKIQPPRMKSFPVAGEGSMALVSFAETFVAALDPALTTPPEVGDFIEVGDRQHQVVPPVEIVRSGDSIAGYRLRWAG